MRHAVAVVARAGLHDHVPAADGFQHLLVLAETAAGQDDGLGVDLHHPVGTLGVDAGDGAVVHDELACGGLIQNGAAELLYAGDHGIDKTLDAAVGPPVGRVPMPLALVVVAGILDRDALLGEPVDVLDGVGDHGVPALAVDLPVEHVHFRSDDVAIGDVGLGGPLGIQDERLPRARVLRSDAPLFLGGRADAHDALGDAAAAAGDLELFEHDDPSASEERLHGGDQTRRARTHDRDITVLNVGDPGGVVGPVVGDCRGGGQSGRCGETCESKATGCNGLPAGQFHGVFLSVDWGAPGSVRCAGLERLASWSREPLGPTPDLCRLLQTTQGRWEGRSPGEATHFVGLISNVSRTLWAESAFPHLTERIVGRRDACVLAFSQLGDLRGAVRMTSGGMLAPAPGSPSRTHPNALGTVGFSGCGRG